MTYVKLSFKRYQISVGLTATFITLCLISLFCALGTWQWQRFQQKQNSPTKPSPPLQISGHFLNQNSILLDNQMYQGQRGYRVFTPFIQDNSPIQEQDNSPIQEQANFLIEEQANSPIILIDRGWIPQTPDGLTSAIIPHMRGQLIIQGYPTKAPSSGLKWWGRTQIFKDRPDGSHHPQKTPCRVLSLDFEQISLALGKPLATFVLRLDPENPMAFVYPPQKPGTSAMKHLGYALQWFMMALVVLIYYGVINTKRILSS